MRFLISLASLTFVVWTASVVQAQWPQTTSPCGGRFWVEAGAGAFERPGTTLGIALVTDSQTNDILLDTDTLTSLGGAGGADIRFGSRGPWGNEWEFCAALANWGSDLNLAQANMETPFLPGFSPDSIGITYDSNFYDLEFNIRRAILPGLTILAGPRYFNFRDEMQLRTQLTFQGPIGPITVNTTNDLNTSNTMVGAQIGLELNQPVTRDIFVHGFIKAAGMGNSAEVERTAISDFAPTTFTRDTKDTPTFIGQTGGRVYVALVPDTIHSYVGYEATWVDGIALGPTQAITQTNQDVFTANTVFWHAITFGLSFTY